MRGRHVRLGDAFVARIEPRLPSLNTNSIAIPRSEVASPLERWYVLIVMCLVYAINIAARYVVTTVFEPIRLELGLTDAGAAKLEEALPAWERAQERMQSRLSKGTWSSLLDLLPELTRLADTA